MVRVESPEERMTKDEFENPKAGGGTAAPGKAHLVVNEVAVGDTRTDCVFEVLAHEDDSQVGKKSYCTFFHSARAQKRMVYFVAACGVYTYDDYEADLKLSDEIDIPIEKTMGCQFCGEIESRKGKNGKMYNNINWGFYAVDSPSSADFPKAGQNKTSSDTQEDEDLVF